MPPPVLSPGSGFSGATSPSPAGPIGSGRGDDATVICRWIDLPFQTRNGGFTMVVPAWHIAGMDYAEVFLDGGTKLTINAVSIDAGTGYEGYVFSVPSGLADGPHEIRLFAYPLKGYPRSLSGPLDTSDAAQQRGEHSFFFYTNEDETLPEAVMWVDKDAVFGSGSGTELDPFRLLSEAMNAGVTALGGDPSGLIIRMKSAGSYGTPNCFTQYDNGRPVIVEGHPDLANTECVIDFNDATPPRGFQAQHVHIRNCTIKGAVQWNNDANDCLVTLDDVILRGTDYTTTMSPFVRAQWSLGIYATNIVYHDMNTAALELSLIVAYEIYNIGEDCLREARGFMVDGYVHDVRMPVPNHGNLWQWAGNFSYMNVAAYGLRSIRIGIPTELPDPILIRNTTGVPPYLHRDFAFVNCDIHAGGNSLFNHSMNHLLLWYVTDGTNNPTSSGGSLSINDDPPDSPVTTVENLSIRNSFIKSLGLSTVPRGSEPVYNGGGGTTPDGTENWADNNHFIDNAAGTNNTTGSSESACFVNPALDNWLPKASGPLVGRVATPLVGVDANWSPRVNNGAIGAYEEDSVPTNPPVLTDITRNFQVGIPFSATIPNSGDPADSVAVTDPTHLPAWATVAVVAGVVTITGTPT